MHWVQVGMLLQEAKFHLITLDVERIVVHYPSLFELAMDLRGAGEQVCSPRATPLRRDTLLAAAGIYASAFGNGGEGGNDGEGGNGGAGTQGPTVGALGKQERGEGGVRECPAGVQASFNILFGIAWKPDPHATKAPTPSRDQLPKDPPPFVFQNLTS